MNIVVELEFPWCEEGAKDDEEAFGELVLITLNSAPIHPQGGVVASVKTVRGSMATARRITRTET